MFVDDFFKGLYDANVINDDCTPKSHLSKFLKGNKALNDFLFTNTKFAENATYRERIYCLKNNISKIPLCETCGTPVKFRNDGRYAGSYAIFCSRGCISKGNSTKIKKKNTTLLNYGVENPFQSTEVKQKIRKTLLEKYNVESPLQNKDILLKMKNTMVKRYGEENARYVDKFNNKIKITNMERYGVENPFQSTEIKLKIKKTNLQKYGTEYPAQNTIIKEKIKKTNLLHYGVQYYPQLQINSKSLELLMDGEWLIEQHYTNKHPLYVISEMLGVSQSLVSKYFQRYNIPVQNYNKSVGEGELCEFISEFEYDIVSNSRKIIPPYELDIYIPQREVAVEYCGLYWHSEQNGKDKDYHKRKYEMCYKRGIHLITIFDDQWINNSSGVKNVLKCAIEHHPATTKQDKMLDLCVDNINNYIDSGYEIIKEYAPEEYYTGVWNCGYIHVKRTKVDKVDK